MKKEKILIMLTLVLILPIVPFQNHQENYDSLSNNPNKIYSQKYLTQPVASIKKIAEYILQDPIAILNDSAFGPTGYNFNGSGTYSDPYQIIGYNITDNTDMLIRIEDTTKYFTISNCYLNGSNSVFPLIYLENVMHGKIEGNIVCDTQTSGITLELSSNNNTLSTNTIYDCQYGIKLDDSSNNNLTTNTISNCSRDCIYLVSSSNNNILSYNTIHNTDDSGICLDSSCDDNTLFTNIIQDSDSGIILMESCNNNTILSNTILDCMNQGIYIDGCNNNTILSNTILDCMNQGIYIHHGNDNTMSSNTIHNCTYGISLDFSDHNNITKNTLFNNSEYSIYLYSTSDDNRIEWNTFLDSTTQAYDDGSSNVFEYNYWDNYYRNMRNSNPSIDGFVDSPYLIEGKSDPTNKGLNLNGTTYSHLINNPVGTFATDNITVEMWIKLRRTDVDSGLFSYASSAHTNDLLIYYEREYGIEIYINGIRLRTYCILNENVWTNLVVTWNNTNGETTLWKNGILRCSSSLATGHIFGTGGSFVLGQDQDTIGGGFQSSQSFNGIFDEVRILTRVLDQNEIQADYSAFGQYPSRSDTIGWYHLNDSGLIATDSTGIVGSGTVNSSQWIDGVNVGNSDPHPRIAPIWINENSDFMNFATTGTGNENDPYLLEGYFTSKRYFQFSNINNVLIKIINTTAYFQISNSILHCLGNNHIGIVLQNVTHGILENNTIYDCQYGIKLDDSCNNNTLSTNTIYDCYNSINLEDSCNNNTLSTNTIYDCNDGINLEDSCNNNTLSTNTIYDCNNNGIELVISCYNNTLSTNTIYDCDIGINLVISCNNNTLSTNTIYDCEIGIIMEDSCNNNLTTNTIYDCNFGLFIVDDSRDNVLTTNIVYNCLHDGISLLQVSYNDILKNLIYNCSGNTGIYLDGSVNNTLSNNTVYNCLFGFYMENSNNNSIRDNIIYNSTYEGLYIDSNADNNTVSWNNFVDNYVNSGHNQSYDESTDNNISYNYWNDHTSPDDTPTDGIVDTPYNIEGGSNQDLFPLTTPVLPKMSIVSPSAQYYATNTITVKLSGFALYYKYYIEGVDNENQTWTSDMNRTLPDGIYTLYAYSSDILDNYAKTSVIFTIDAFTSPTITLMSPTNVTIHPSGTTIEISVYDVSLETVLYNWDGTSNHTWNSEYETLLPTGETQHILYVYAKDSANHWATAKFVYTTDDTAPTIALMSPTNATTHPLETIINLTVADTHLETVLYNWDNNTNQTLTAPYNVTLPTEAGQHILRVYAKDNAGHWTLKTYIFTTKTKSSDLGSIIIVGGIVVTLTTLGGGGFFLFKKKGLNIQDLLRRGPPED